MPPSLTPLKPPHLSLDTFKALCNAAAEFCSLAPWEYLCDAALLGIQNTATGSQIRLASVLGNEEPPVGLLVHRGEQGLRWAITVSFGGDKPENDDPNFMYSLDALMVEFVPRDNLEKHDLALLGQIGFKPLPRVQRKWLKFRSYRPGAVPWFLEQAEAELLLSDLRDTIVFARLVAGKKDLFDDRANNEVPFLPQDTASTGSVRAEDLVWQKLVLAPELLPAPVLIPDSELAALVALPQNEKLSVELDCLYAPGGVDEEPRPHFPWMAIAVDAHNGILLGSAFDNSQTQQKPEPVAARCLLQTLTKLNCRPAEILVARCSLASALEPITRLLGIRVSHITKLVQVEENYRRLQRNMDLSRC